MEQSKSLAWVAKYNVKAFALLTGMIKDQDGYNADVAPFVALSEDDDGDHGLWDCGAVDVSPTTITIAGSEGASGYGWGAKMEFNLADGSYVAGSLVLTPNRRGSNLQTEDEARQHFEAMRLWSFIELDSFVDLDE